MQWQQASRHACPDGVSGAAHAVCWGWVLYRVLIVLQPCAASEVHAGPFSDLPHAGPVSHDMLDECPLLAAGYHGISGPAAHPKSINLHCAHSCMHSMTKPGLAVSCVPTLQAVAPTCTCVHSRLPV